MWREGGVGPGWGGSSFHFFCSNACLPLGYWVPRHEKLYRRCFHPHSQRELGARWFQHLLLPLLWHQFYLIPILELSGKALHSNQVVNAPIAVDTQQIYNSIADWLHNPCGLGGPKCFKAGGQNQQWPTSGLIGYMMPAVWRVPNASKRGTKSVVAHKWADWLHNPRRLGGPQCFKAGDKISNGPQVGGLRRFTTGYKMSSGPQMGAF